MILETDKLQSFTSEKKKFVTRRLSPGINEKIMRDHRQYYEILKVKKNVDIVPLYS